MTESLYFRPTASRYGSETFTDREGELARLKGSPRAELVEVMAKAMFEEREAQLGRNIPWNPLGSETDSLRLMILRGVEAAERLKDARRAAKQAA